MRPRIGRDPFRVGVVALAVLGLLGAGVVVLSTASFGTRDYTAVLEHTAGLRVGESVQVAGVDVGEVTAVDLDGDQVRVGFELDEDIRLGDATTAAVKVATLLGTHYLEIDPQGAGTLADGTIPLARTTVPFNLQDVIDAGTQRLDELDPVLLGQALSTVADTLEAGGEELGPALDGISRVSQVVSRRSDQLGSLLAAARQVSDQLESGRGDVVGLLEQATLVTDELNRRRAAISELLTDVRDLARTLSGMVDDTEDDLRPALRDVGQVLRVLRERKADLAVALERIAVTGRYVANATGNGPYLDLYLPDGTPDNLTCLTGRC